MVALLRMPPQSRRVGPLAACPMLTDACARALSALREAAFDLRGVRVRPHPGAGCIARALCDRVRFGNARSATRGNCAPRAECGASSSTSASSPVTTRARVSRASAATPAGAGRGAAHPRAPRALGARARRVGSTRTGARLAAKRGHPHPPPRGPRHRDRPTRLRIGALSTSSALQSAGRRRNILRARCSAALNQQQTAAIGPTRVKRQD